MWSPWLAHWFHLRPGDLYEMTPSQLWECVEFVKKTQKAQRQG